MPSRRRRVDRQRLPIPALILAIIAIAFFALPFIGLVWRTPWRLTWEVLTDPDVRQALWLSIWCSLWATALSIR